MIYVFLWAALATILGAMVVLIAAISLLPPVVAWPLSIAIIAAFAVGAVAINEIR